MFRYSTSWLLWQQLLRQIEYNGKYGAQFNWEKIITKIIMKILTKVQFEKEIHVQTTFSWFFIVTFRQGVRDDFRDDFQDDFFPHWIGSPRTLIDPNVAALTSSRRIWSATRLGEDMSSEAVPRSGVSRSLPASLDASCMRWVHIRLGIIVIMRRADSKSQVRQCLGFVQLIFGPCWTMNQLNKNPNIA